MNNSPSKKIVFLHGFMGSPDESEFLRPLSSEIFAPELAQYYSAEKINTLFEQIHSFDPHVIYGYSMGGRIALRYLESHKNKNLEFFCLESAALLNLDKNEQRKRLHADQMRAHQIIHDFSTFLKEWYDLPLWGNLSTLQREQFIELRFEKFKNKTEILADIITELSPAIFTLPELIDLPQELNYLYFYGEQDHKYKSMIENLLRPLNMKIYQAPDVGHNIHQHSSDFIVQVLKSTFLP